MTSEQCDQRNCERSSSRVPVILHADLDAFYASVEQMDAPELRGRPVLVGPRGGRGVVLTASYEARRYRVGSAMPVQEALRRCPGAVVVPPRFSRYKELSEATMEVFRSFSPVVQALSLDEAFLDITGSIHLFGNPVAMAGLLRERVRRATGGLEVSVGIARNKFVAKVASGYAKPNGVLVVPPEGTRDFLRPLSVRWLWGAGPKTTARLQSLDLHTIGDVAALSKADATARVGTRGLHFRRLARGEDDRVVANAQGQKTLGSDRTLPRNLRTRRQIVAHVNTAADRVARRLRRQGYVAAGVRIKLRYADFRTTTRQQLLPATDLARSLSEHATRLVLATWDGSPVRLVGLSAFALGRRDSLPCQQDLFVDLARNRNLEEMLDRITERYGEHAIERGSAVGRASLLPEYLD